LATCPVFAQTPSANFTASPISGCSPLIVQFQDQSSGNPTSWSWDLGNGNVSTLQHPQATYFTPGTYTVRLTATNASGTNTLTRAQYITVYQPPVVNFSGSPLSGCFPLHTRFTDLSTVAAGSSIVGWQWDFGNGVTSVLQNPVADYTSSGVFAITLKVTDDKGCSRILGRSSYINVTPGVTASFSPTPAIACVAPANIGFNNTSTGPGSISYQWNFGDGGVSAAVSPNHTFSSEGPYTVQLIATSTSGCTDTIETTVSVGGFNSSFQFSGTACPGSGMVFTNTSSPRPDSVRWRFGDGGISTDTMPSHVYGAPGTYTVWLYNYFGNCVDSASRQVIINTPPTANFNASNTGTCQESLTVNFQDLSVGAVSWLWNFGDNTSSALQNPSHTYNGYGAYPVTLTVTNSDGCSHTITRPGYITLQRPQITVPQLPASGCIPYTLSPVPVISSPEPIVSFNWDFGDGGSSALQQPTHTYTTDGIYTVKLFFTTSGGCRDSLIFTSSVTAGTKPVASFSATPIESCASTPVSFTNLSSPFTQLIWNFGDSTGSADNNPVKTYTDTGYFDVQLIAINYGCADTATITDYIHILPPIARFEITPNCGNRFLFSFTDNSILAQTWLWDFGDGTTSTAQNPTHTYPAFGIYSVKLTVTNGACTHSLQRDVAVSKQAPDFSVSSPAICRGTQVTFTPSNFNTIITTALYWNFGDGVEESGFGLGPATHIYTASGSYNVMLITLDPNGCRDTTIKNAFVRVNGPVANFTAPSLGACNGNTVTFTDQSVSDGVNPVTNWLWDFGDGTVRAFTAPPFTHQYSVNGTFTIKLIATDASGCSDSITRQSYITITSPDVAFTESAQITCPGSPVLFTNTTVPPPVSILWNFGDGTTSAQQTISHIYSDTGSYTVSLTITDSVGCTDSLVKTNLVRVVLPVAGFTVNDSFSACTPLEVQFTNTSQNAVSSVWDFGPGEGNSSLTDPVHYYSTPGIYRVKLLITSAGGCQDSAFMNITVVDTAGIRFSYTPLGGCNPLQVTFNAIGPLSTQSYFWDFGDGTELTTVPNITHQYQSFGNFLPKVVLLDPPGCVIPVTGPDTIRIPGANVKFGLSDSILCDAGLVNFTDSTTSSDPIVSYNWNFGDGTNSTQQNPAHYYSSPGNYDVTLTTITQSNCTNVLSKKTAVKVVARPDIAIISDSTACIFDSLLHRGIFLQPDTSVVTWQWIFPNGNTSNVQTPPAQTYNPGSFTVYAYATNSTGCVDTATKQITVFPLPTVDLPGQMVIAVGFADTIPASYSAGVNQWNWTPPYALSCFDCPRPVANPKSTTTYQVAFTDINGCRNTGRIEVVVICKDANFYIPNTFSPNGDGSNDRFYPRGKGLYLIRAMRVFNRWGEIVFENRNFSANDALAGWDGKYKGKTAQPDVYVYQVEIQCDNGELIRLTGNIALIL
jgi:gliding motility-associated-like protein